MKIRLNLLLLSLTGFFTACGSGQLLKDQPLSANSASGVIVMGVDLQSDFKSPLLVFLKFDPGTGKVVPGAVKSVTPSKEGLTGAQKFGAVMSGQTSLPRGKQYFVFELPPGDWFFYSISGSYSDGLSSSYSAVSYMSEGTIAFQSSPGTARYVGEYGVTGKFGEAIRMLVLDQNHDAAQAELRKYPNITLPLQASKPSDATFTCEFKSVLMSSAKFCQSKTVVLKVRRGLHS
jgi:hypothetical protein